jgi:hypothetical protein
MERRYHNEGRDVLGEALAHPHQQAIDGATGTYFKPVQVVPTKGDEGEPIYEGNAPFLRPDGHFG